MQTASNSLRFFKSARLHCEQAFDRFIKWLVERANASRRGSIVWRYGTALLALTCAIAVRQLFNPALSDRLPFITLFGAVAFTVWFCGTRPAILTIVCGDIVVEFVFINPGGAFSLQAPPFLVGRIAYSITCAVIVFLGYVAIHSEQITNEQRIRLEVAQRSANAGLYEWELGEEHAMWSPELRSLFGISNSHPATLKSFQQLLHPDDRERVLAELLALRNDPRDEFESTYQIVTPCGEVRCLLSRGRVLPETTGSRLRILGLCVDISHQRLTEQALLRNEKLLAASRMASTVAHELNNPLQAALSLLYLLNRDPGLSPQSSRLAKSAEEEVRRVALMAQRSLNFFHDPASAHPVELGDLVKEVIDLHRRRAEVCGINVQISVEPNCTVTINPSELKQLLANLVLNALDSMISTGGSLSVTASPEGAFVKLAVQDTGTGIRDHQIERIFDPFFTTKGTVGTGLGLWTSKNIVESYGGSLTVRTNTTPEHHGTVFTAMLPLAARTAVATK